MMKKLLFTLLVCLSLTKLQAQCTGFGIDVSADLSACEGDSATLTVMVNGGTAPFDLDYTYYDTSATFLNGSGTLSLTTIHVLYTHHQNSTFYFEVTDANGCVDGDTIIIHNAICDSIDPCENFQTTYAFPDGDFCNGDTIGFILAVMDGVAPYTYTWDYLTGSDSVTQNSDSYSGELILVDGGVLLVTISDSIGCIWYESFITATSSACDSFPVGITTPEQKDLLSLYPNPAHTQLSVQINDDSRGSTFSLSNHLGQVVKTMSLTASTKIIDVRDLSEGIYFASIQTKEGMLRTQKVVIQK